MSWTADIAGLDNATGWGERPVHLAIGMFDGVHLGHRSVMDAAVVAARRTDGVAVALTFDPHPSRVLRPDAAVRLLMPAKIKARRLRQLGAESVITQSFTREFAAVSAEEFVPMLQRALPHLRMIYVGENWRFGQGRIGDVTMLQTLASERGVGVYSAPRVNLDGAPISSTRIRAALAAGDLATVNALLGYAYQSAGEVVPGRKLGRTMGFPTLNFEWDPESRPAYGVYAVRFGRLEDERLEGRGVANYGLRPTVETNDHVVPLLEVHGLDGDVNYETGDLLAVEWCRHIRAEQRFANVEVLRKQISRDVEIAKRFFRTKEK